MVGGGPTSHRKRRATAEDATIGLKVRALRVERGLSQTGLAEGVGVTFQQVQKYEKGANRISAGRLQQIARLLNVPVTYFYGAPTKGLGTSAGLEMLQTKGAFRMVKGFNAIESRGVKYALLQVVEALAGVEPRGDE
jgi:transcriptional regulator with XRE-family HTH domain